jgi:hypothetical protein
MFATADNVIKTGDIFFSYFIFQTFARYTKSQMKTFMEIVKYTSEPKMQELQSGFLLFLGGRGHPTNASHVTVENTLAIHSFYT